MLIAPHNAKNIKRILVFTYYALLVGCLLTLPAAHNIWYAIFAVLSAYYLAGVTSGIMHFVLDYKKTPENIGLEELFHYKGSRSSEEYNAKKNAAFRKINVLQRIVFYFKLHHPFPAKIGRQSYAHLCWLTIIYPGIPFLALDVLTRPYFNSLPISLFLLTYSLLMANSQFLHSLPHRKKVPSFFKFLMDRGLLISKKKHAIHHATLDRDFCTISGHGNGLVNFITRFLLRNNYFSKDGLEPHG